MWKNTINADCACTRLDINYLKTIRNRDDDKIGVPAVLLHIRECFSRGLAFR